MALLSSSTGRRSADGTPRAKEIVAMPRSLRIRAALCGGCDGVAGVGVRAAGAQFKSWRPRLGPRQFCRARTRSVEDTSRCESPKTPSAGLPRSTIAQPMEVSLSATTYEHSDLSANSSSRIRFKDSTSSMMDLPICPSRTTRRLMGSYANCAATQVVSSTALCTAALGASSSCFTCFERPLALLPLVISQWLTRVGAHLKAA